MSFILSIFLGTLIFASCGNQGGEAATEAPAAAEETNAEPTGQAFLTSDESGTPNILELQLALQIIKH